jgi:hypothetical protein
MAAIAGTCLVEKAPAIIVRTAARGSRSPVLTRISSQTDLSASIDRIKPARRPMKARRRIFMDCCSKIWTEY